MTKYEEATELLKRKVNGTGDNYAGADVLKALELLSGGYTQGVKDGYQAGYQQARRDICDRMITQHDLFREKYFVHVENGEDYSVIEQLAEEYPDIRDLLLLRYSPEFYARMVELFKKEDYHETPDEAAWG